MPRSRYGGGITEQEQQPKPRRTYREASLLGFLLSSAHGFGVLGPNGGRLGVLDSMRYERHADFPEEIVVRRGRLFWRRYRRIPFDWIRSVDTHARTVRLARSGAEEATRGVSR